MADLQDWTSCQVHGHIYNIGNDPEEESEFCIDCGEPREQD